MMHVHVFPAGRMCSLRRALLLWLVPVFLLVGMASAAFSYWSYNAMVSTFMDEQMEQLADSIAANEDQILPPAPSAQRIHKWGTYVMQVYGNDGQLQHTSWPQLAASLQDTPGFHDIDRDGTSWRSYTTPPSGPTGLTNVAAAPVSILVRSKAKG